jgi:hypothetical protein
MSGAPGGIDLFGDDVAEKALHIFIAVCGAIQVHQYAVHAYLR